MVAAHSVGKVPLRDGNSRAMRPPSSRETDDPSLGIDVDALGGGPLGESGHADDVAGQGHEESRSGGDLDVPDRQREAARPPSPKMLAVAQGTPRPAQESWTIFSSSAVSVANWLIATTVGLPKWAALSRWAARFSRPRSTAAGSACFKESRSAPPCILSAR